jgi:hypothetical protein
MEELETCPLCDGQAKLCHGLPSTQNRGTYQSFVRCKKCGCKTKTFFQAPYESKADVDKAAKDSWNRRVALESDNTEVLEAYQRLLQKSQELSQTLLEKLKVMDEGENKPLTIRELRELAEADETVYEADGTQWDLYPGDNNRIRALYTAASGGQCDIIVDEYKIANGFFLYASKPEGSEAHGEHI